MKKRIMSFLCSFAILGVLFSIAFMEVNAEETKTVDGSYLTDKNESMGNAVLKTRGAYLMEGDCSISSAGRGRIYIYGSTTANFTVDILTLAVIVEQYNETTKQWDQVHYVAKDATNDYYISLGETVLVDRGYYYRVRATHSAGPKDALRDEANSFTDGIMIK